MFNLEELEVEKVTQKILVKSIIWKVWILLAILNSKLHKTTDKLDTRYSKISTYESK